MKRYPALLLLLAPGYAMASDPSGLLVFLVVLPVSLSLSFVMAVVFLLSYCRNFYARKSVAVAHTAVSLLVAGAFAGFMFRVGGIRDILGSVLLLLPVALALLPLLLRRKASEA